jgi:hypothetical protein
VVLIAYYVIFMVAGDLAAYLIGLVVEREFGGQVSLIVFLFLYFLFLWVAWLLAVRLTEPKREASTKRVTSDRERSGGRHTPAGPAALLALADESHRLTRRRALD